MPTVRAGSAPRPPGCAPPRPPGCAPAPAPISAGGLRLSRALAPHKEGSACSRGACPQVQDASRSDAGAHSAVRSVNDPSIQTRNARPDQSRNSEIKKGLVATFIHIVANTTVRATRGKKHRIMRRMERALRASDRTERRGRIYSHSTKKRELWVSTAKASTLPYRTGGKDSCARSAHRRGTPRGGRSATVPRNASENAAPGAHLFLAFS